MEAMRRGDAVTMGQLLDASHDSLRDDFEISNDALNVLVEIARADVDCYGACITGTRFGGNAMVLVRTQAAHAFSNSVAQSYQRRTGLASSGYVCLAAECASVISLA
jgi:galactokinase